MINWKISVWLALTLSFEVSMLWGYGPIFLRHCQWLSHYQRLKKKLAIVFFTAEIKYTYKNRPGKICSRLHLNKTKRYEMIWAICYHFYNLKNVSNTHEGVLLLVKLQNSACKFIKSNTPPWMFFTFFYIVQVVPKRAKHLKWSVSNRPYYFIFFKDFFFFFFFFFFYNKRIVFH